MTTKEEIIQKLESLGLSTDLSLIESNIVSNLDSNINKMFEQFMKLMEFYNSDENVFKMGKIGKLEQFPASICATFAEQKEILDESLNQQIKPRYVFMKHFFKNWNIACSSTLDKKQGNKSDQSKEIMSAFINFQSAIEYQKARSGFMEDTENQASDKLQAGVMKR